MRKNSLFAVRHWCTGVAVLCGLAFGATTSLSAQNLRQYYLTQSSGFSGSNAKTACTTGYHMASLWEIFETSNLRYNISLGHTRADAGSGPPAGASGWIRTGFDSFNTIQANAGGAANCLSYTSTGGIGTTVFLATPWQGTPLSPIVSPWVASTHACNATTRVWCVLN